jgi:hypothetical protein
MSNMRTEEKIMGTKLSAHYFPLRPIPEPESEEYLRFIAMLEFI